MNVMELTRQLGAAIQEEDTYIRYQMARQANDEDEELQGKIGEFNLLRMSLSNELSKSDDEKSQSKVEELNKSLQEMYGQIMQNPNMAAYNAAKEAMDQLLNRVNSILMLCVNGEDPATCEPSECTGSCSSCGGCH